MNPRPSSPIQLKISIYAKKFLSIYFAFKEFGQIFRGTPKLVIILTDIIRHTIFPDENHSTDTLKVYEYLIQYNFSIAKIPGKNNTDADHLSRLEISVKEKITFRLQEDKPTTPIELHVQSAAVSEEEQIVFTEDGDETEEQLLQRKKEAWI